MRVCGRNFRKKKINKPPQTRIPFLYIGVMKRGADKPRPTTTEDPIMGMKEQAEAATRTIIKRIEGALETGEKLTWGGACVTGLPTNFTTGKAYRGWNVFQLWMSGFSSPYWAGLKQILNAGGRVRREEFGRPTWIMLWQRRKLKPKPGEEDKEERFFWFSKALKVYNVEQCEGLPEGAIRTPEGAENVPELDEFFEAYADADDLRMEFETDTPFPCYVPALDVVRMPERARCFGTEAFYSSLAHEATHATGHSKRLDRDHAFGSTKADYSKEELVAEFGAAILGAILGFNGEKKVDDHAAYLRGWLKPLQDDPTFLITAASAAQKAVDRIMRKAGAPLDAPVEAEPEAVEV